MNTRINRNNMAKLIVASAVLLLASIPVFAATTGTLSLQGTVAGVLDIAVAPQPEASALDLSVNQANLLVANVTEKSNRKAGYTVTLTSQNAGAGSAFFFKSADAANADTLAYTLAYNGAAVNLVAGTALITDAGAKTPAAGVTKDLRISYNGAAAFMNEDTYADTLTFTITAK